MNTIPNDWKSEIPYSRRLIDGRVCGVQNFMYTAGLLIDLTFQGEAMFYDYSARYCYPDVVSAVVALATWDGEGDPPGNWVKEKVSERLGPGALE